MLSGTYGPWYLPRKAVWFLPGMSNATGKTFFLLLFYVFIDLTHVFFSFSPHFYSTFVYLVYYYIFLLSVFILFYIIFYA